MTWDIKGKTVVITGASSGIGAQAARTLHDLGAEVLVIGRAPDRTAAVAAEVGTEPIVADFTRLSDVRRAAEEILDRYERVDALVNNAGISVSRREVTDDGHELMFQVNHLAPFLLTTLLLEGPLSGPGVRIVNVSSIAHNRGRMNFEDLQLARGYNGYGAYAQSKLANVLFTLELAQRVPAELVTVNCLHPGVVSTKLLLEGFGMQGNDTLEQAAATSVYLAWAPEAAKVTGRYFVRQREASPSPSALDEETRRRLWEISETLCASR